MKKIFLTVFSLALALSLTLLTACSEKDGTEKVIPENEAENAQSIDAAVSAMDDHTLCIQDKVNWGDDYETIKGIVEEPYINDTGIYLTSAFYSALPGGDGWKKDDGTIDREKFITVDILSYYAVDTEIGLYEYGYKAPDANLYQYDFLKEYYTNKYGEPTREDWEWNDPDYEPTGDEDYYQMFADGLVKVLTVWDIEELDTVLVVDWLNDPVQYDNNYGQISFYQRSDDFDADALAEEEDL